MIARVETAPRSLVSSSRKIISTINGRTTKDCRMRQRKTVTTGLLVAGIATTTALAGCSSSASSSSSATRHLKWPGLADAHATEQLRRQRHSDHHANQRQADQGRDHSDWPARWILRTAHIHQGTCANLNPTPQFFLTDSGTATNGGQLWLQNGRPPSSSIRRWPRSRARRTRSTSTYHRRICRTTWRVGTSRRSNDRSCWVGIGSTRTLSIPTSGQRTNH